MSLLNAAIFPVDAYPSHSYVSGCFALPVQIYTPFGGCSSTCWR